MILAFVCLHPRVQCTHSTDTTLLAFNVHTESPRAQLLLEGAVCRGWGCSQHVKLLLPALLCLQLVWDGTDSRLEVMTALQAEVRVLQKGVEKKLRVSLRSPHRLIPVHIQGRPPPYFILGGLVFTQVISMLC